MGSRIASQLPDGVAQFREERVLGTERNGASHDRQRTGLKRSPLKRKKRLSPIGRLRRVTQQIYQEKRRNFLATHPICEFPGCFDRSLDVHHMQGRTGKNYLDTSTWMAVDRKCHNWIHANARQAREMGLLK